MSNKKQTAVDWLLNDYVNKGLITIEAIEQAKKIEKQQIIDALRDGYSYLGDKYDNEQYYKETYE
jgi:hypothetical protein